MSKIVKISEEIDQEKLSKAEELHKEVLARTYLTAHSLLELGKLFKTIRDEKLYVLLGADTFNEYCGFPEISFGRSTIYSFIHTYELYVLKLEVLPEYLSKVGHRKLQIISPLVEDDTNQWLEYAYVLSESDLINEVRRAQGKPEMLPKPKEDEDVYPFSFNNYKEFVVNSPCCVCGHSPPSEPAHFPRTRGAGGEEVKEHIIPLCHECHIGRQHADPFDFAWMNLHQICSTFFFRVILKAYEIIRREK